ncbi:MAG TPA: methyltransferase [Spirochaetota bacterium]|nr:methyltransferase [Spirochaetota bacterium]HPC42960.1 methyltransferase [Spirochaetota bacterium]HPL18954.1 methyltransferase [Spirochaetota bacterium]HQF07625.1 methyltransferase [Spirochaetota bacterium]HQH96356.1 methyltransferase [Spirochaetota bacterium]
MPLHINILENIGILRLNQGPAPIIDILAMMSFKALVSALRLGIFEIIGHGGKTAGEIAAAAHIDPRGLTLLLDLLENIGYITCRRGTYRNTGSTKKWLLADSSFNITDLFYHFNDMASRWEYLDASIRKGAPPMMGWEWLDRDAERWHTYHAGMKSSAILISREVMKKVKLSPYATSLIDLGGSHGQYCIEFCRRYPGLKGIIYDWAPAEKTAVENIDSCNMGRRVTFRAGDFIRDPIGSDYDVVLMFNIIRIYRPDDLKSLFKKIFDSTAPNGMVIIMDHLGHRPWSRFMRANALLLLLELYNSTEGKTHDKDDVAGMLKECGFAHVRDYNLRRSPGLGVVTAIKG